MSAESDLKGCELCHIAHNAATNTEYVLAEAIDFLMRLLTPEQMDAYRSRYGQTFEVKR